MISIKCFKGLPVEYESFLIDKYNSFITTCRYIEVYCSSFDINYMIVYKNSKLVEILIFGNKGKTSTCFNSLVEINQDIIFESTKYIFEKYPFIQKVKIVSSYQKYFFEKSFLLSKSDDHILSLPSTMDDYYRDLGRSTRQNIKNRTVRLLRDYPQVKFATKFGLEIEESLVNKILQLNLVRMKNKGTISRIDSNYTNNIYKYSQHYGCVAYLEIDDVIVAGSINTILNKGLFGHVTAFDKNFSKYNVGEICAFYLIQTSIDNGLSTLHFLWGESDLKSRLLAKPRLLFSYFIYREYSSDYVYYRAKTIYISILESFKRSKYSRPIKDAIKMYRRKI